VEETPILRNIREHVITVITPVQELDGRDRQVDVYNYGRAHHGVRPGLIYWGKYTAHDNNRDGMVLSQALTRNMLAQYFYWHPTVQHDLHESVPFLYTSTGTGPYKRRDRRDHHQRVERAGPFRRSRSSPSAACPGCGPTTSTMGGRPTT